jgi:asparagine synthase (glutamine-hydrolysing)
MSGALQHRGPDHGGQWIDDASRVALGHRRLAIVELSAAGDQPMHSASGRYVLVFNGEIYNHDDIRREVTAAGLAPSWRGHSDTETLLAAVEAWGISGALERSIGMFALAVWDRGERRLSLARDRLGEKPLYLGWQGAGSDRTFLFGSELKALTGHPSFVSEIDRGALSLYMRHNCIPAPYSIYRGIRKLQPGTFLTILPDGTETEPVSYWSATAVAEAGAADPLRLSPEEAVDELERLLMDAVGRQMMSDVPLGAFLSGGIDSSTVVALMQAQSSRPVKTFTIGFEDQGYNEADHAREVAHHLGTEHTEHFVTPEEARAVISQLPTMYDEPFADSSQIPTFLVSQLARRHVTVSLSGDAGDELFGGYDRYTMASRYWRSVSSVPGPLRAGLARGIRSVAPDRWNAVARTVGRVVPKSVSRNLAGDRMHKIAGAITSQSMADLYRGMTSHWQDPASLVIGGQEPPTLLTGNQPHLEGLSDVERMMALDLVTYLPDDILAKVDRAAMAVSLETRVPFLDHRVVEFAWRMPFNLKIRDGQSKWALRQVLYRHVPREMMERPKQGFGVPIGGWLRGPLREWAEELLDEARLRREGFFDPAPIRALWDAHRAGRVTEPHLLWDVLMFQAWLDARESTTSGLATAGLSAVA